MDIEDYLPKLNRTAQKFFDKVQEKLRYCVYCQPYDGGDYIWVFGQRIELDELLDNINVPERYRDVIAQNLSCPYCGRQRFERYEDVGLEERYIVKLHADLDAAERKFGRIIDEFQSHLEKYPALGLSHPLGRKIFKEITGGKLVTAEVSGDFFRARLVKDAQVLESKDLGAPPLGVSSDGRYHHAGQSVLYVAKEQDIAISEILELNIEKALVWVQKYEIPQIKNILDLTDNEDNLLAHTSPLMLAILSKRVLKEIVEDRKKTWKPQYFIPRFISDCVRLAGFSGIKYSSTRSYGENFVFFYPDKLTLKEIERPKVLMYEKQSSTLQWLNFDF